MPTSSSSKLPTTNPPANPKDYHHQTPKTHQQPTLSNHHKNLRRLPIHAKPPNWCQWFGGEGRREWDWMNGSKGRGGPMSVQESTWLQFKKKKKIVTLSFLLIFYSNSTFRPLVRNTQIIKTTFFHRFY